MQKKYKVLVTAIFIFCGVSLNTRAQYPVKFDAENLLIQNLNFVARESAEQLERKSANKMKSNLDKMNENLTQVIWAKNVVSDALQNVNSALKNSLAIKDMGSIMIDIYNNSEKLISIGIKHPQYSHITKVYVENTILQALAINNEISSFALKGGNDNVLMNYRHRDAIIRDVYIRLRIINGNLHLATVAINNAISLGFWKGATPFGSWINSDRAIAQDIINRAKRL